MASASRIHEFDPYQCGMFRQPRISRFDVGDGCRGDRVDEQPGYAVQETKLTRFGHGNETFGAAI
jgi:hypothetical protein